MQLLIHIVGRIFRPVKPLVDWVTCELMFGELMGVAIFAALLFGWLHGLRGFSIVVGGYIVSLIVFIFLDYAIQTAETNDD